jgi:hypothetical protein
MLERLYARLGDSGFNGTEIERETAAAAREASAEFEAREGIRLDGLRAARRDLIARMVLAFVQWDLAHLEGWRPAELEQRGEGELGGVRFRIKADRIDVGPGGVRRVIDYKRRLTSSWDTKILTQARRGLKLQGPIYLELMRANEAVFQFVEGYSTCDPQITDLRRTLTRTQWESGRGAIEGAVAGLAQSMRDGWFFTRPSTGQSDHCSYCDFASACRKQRRELGTKAERLKAGGQYWQIVKSGRRS